MDLFSTCDNTSEKVDKVQGCGPDPEPMQRRQTGSDFGTITVSLVDQIPRALWMMNSLQLPTQRCHIFRTIFFQITWSLIPPINTEATTITTSLPEITPFIALQLRVARLEQEMSEVKKTDVLASIRSQVPTAVDNYLGTKLVNALIMNQLTSLYHALMGEALIAGHEAYDMEVIDKVKTRRGSMIVMMMMKTILLGRSLGLAACASLESKNEVCLLCEVKPKQIPAFDFICASLESILAIEDTWERERSGFAGEKVWGDIPVVTGFVGREMGKEGFWGSRQYWSPQVV
ncbi:hypothetical protein Tco_1112491 [Tanacetum coccineum]|uniref:Uncharacterized protein n=1 Tax=Tanacetum coccineum TaxID=301880 RepID=A0ABQ5IPM0_9ASTR